MAKYLQTKEGDNTTLYKIGKQYWRKGEKVCFCECMIERWGERVVVISVSGYWLRDWITRSGKEVSAWRYYTFGGWDLVRYTAYRICRKFRGKEDVRVLIKSYK